MTKIMAACLVVLMLASMAQGARIPEDTVVTVRLGHTISSENAQSGDRWTGTLHKRIVADCRKIARRGDAGRGVVVNASSSGRLSGKALLELQLKSVNGIPVISDTV